MDKASITRLILAIASIVKLFGYDVPEEVLNSIADLVAAGVLAWTTWRNNYISKKGIAQKQVLQQNNLD